MQRALPGSALVHAGVIGLALVGFAWPESDDAPAAKAVSVSIINMSSVSANATEVVQSDSPVNLVSSGGAANAPPIEPIEAEPVEPVTTPIVPVPPEQQLPIADEPVEPTPVEAVAAVEPETQEPLEFEPQEPVEVSPRKTVPVETTAEVALLSSTAPSSMTSQLIAAAAPPTLEPVSSEEIKTAPVPQTLSFERPSEPTNPKPAQPKPRAPAPQPSQSGNDGANDADAVASAGSTAQQAANGSGGDAEVARYPSEVLGKLRRALRGTNASRGEVVVRFTVLANGQVSGISIGRSSGNAAVDQAGLATVDRAAPFPPIPAQAGRSSWTFDVPLAFGG